MKEKTGKIFAKEAVAHDNVPNGVSHVRWTLAKAAEATGAEVSATAAITSMNEDSASWEAAGAETTEYDPRALLGVVKHSPHLIPNIEGYAINIDGHGQRAVPKADWLGKLSSDDAFEEIKAAILHERMTDAENAVGAGEDIDMPDEPTDEEVEAKRTEIKTAMRRELFRFSSWFEHCCSEMSFTALRRAVRVDKESVGWGAVELLRDSRGRLWRLRYVPGHTVRPLSETPELVSVVEENPATILSEGRVINVLRRFPRFAQKLAGKIVYFKSPGDPRAVSRQTGKAYKDEKEMRSEDNEGSDALAAHELLFFNHHDACSMASPPRWISGLVRALGSREADETNYHHLKNKAFTSGILFVSGGRIQDSVRERIEQKIQAEAQGAENAGRILIVEAKPFKASMDERAVVPSVQFQSLRDAHTTDAMFSEYDTRNADSIGALFRQSPLLRGYTPSNLNRATAEVVLRFTEEQVYAPEREDFDWIINKVILPELNIKYHRFESNSPKVQSVDEITEFVKAVAPQGALVPNEIREIAARVLNRQLAPTDEDWGTWPMAMTLAGMSPAANPAGASMLEEQSGAIQNRIAEVENRVARIANEEFRSAGLDLEATVTALDFDEES